MRQEFLKQKKKIKAGIMAPEFKKISNQTEIYEGDVLDIYFN